MPNNVNNVTTGKPNILGSVFVGDTSATLPTDANTALDAGFKCVGYISDNGVENDNSITIQKIKAWGGDTVLSSVTESNDDFKFAMLEGTNVDALKSYYGDDNVLVDPETGNITIHKTGKDLPHKAWVIDQILNSGRLKRIVIPDGQVTARDTISYKDEEAVILGITITAYPNSSGQTHHEYIEGES